jgi:D-3-phosphoglycerate dehydrogenase
MKIMKILVTATSFSPSRPTPALERLQSFAGELVFNPYGKPLSEDQLIPLLRDCDGYVAGLDFVTGKVIEACEKLKVISRYGVGVDRVDLAAAKAKNIAVCNTPGANSQAVAELALALILALARRVPQLDRKVREAQWPRSTGIELRGKTLGILGLGAVGKTLARCASGFSMDILAYDPYLDKTYAEAHGIVPSDLTDLIQKSHILSLHLPLTPQTKHLIDDAAMRAMRPGAILINTARGGLIDEAAAYEHLRSGHLGGLGLDVYEEEPPKPSLLHQLDNVVLTPHTASHTAEATAGMAEMAVQNLIDVLSGKTCPHTL